ncbi:ABC transporter substrate-binding protein [Streptomyces albireticuli]|uniref:Sugar ABC transporter substrate-binding protein n=1 Tax=Streptomyces albireticuli TaxID=1940 RepID=A0A2A2DH53_9ACTN|nr:sugar ABC transporter substrate-binding protein [Streptomyces albireticuli]MCD9141856.1 sugar ABC transporter substrate-binding protein [Streptomyces albireticuli]MCD9163200.1 sugar ABC transporter substrate-binding protein [Streptomyces albireticuli]MCD9190029.1 sugar ABC transporter substrate-binding protein [Streptomyces albireticuli]PAU50640.1 sugar ABC transporter substrate-binding protein [Streptomyces albireticuli]
MPISRRQLMAGGAGLALTGALGSACGSNTGRGGGGSSGPRLSQWYHQYGEAGTRQAVVRYAAAYEKADVRIEWRPGNYDQQTAAALLTSSGPDVFEVSGPTLDQIQGGQVVDLTDLIEDVKDDFSQVVLAPKTHDGRVWGIPQLVDTQLLYYRKSMLRDAGVRPPGSLDELIDAARKLTTGKVKGLFLGNDGGASALDGTPLYAAGLSLVTDRGEVGFDDPAAARTLGKLHRLYADKSLLLGAPTDWADPSAFLQGLTAMQWSGLWALPRIRKELGDDFGVLPFPPDGPAGRPAVPVGAWTAAVSARSEHREAAKAFVKWLWIDRTDHQEDFALSYGFHIPARNSLAAKADRLGQGPAAEVVRFTKEHGGAAQPLLWTPPSRTAYQDALNRVIKGGADPEAELRAAVRKAGAELRRVRKRA